MSHLTTCEDLPSATFSPGSADGLTPSALPDGPTINQSGLAPARASLSPRQAKAMGLMTRATSGQILPGSSASESLSRSLASRLQLVTQTSGSTLYSQTWKEWTTPSGLSRLRQRASVRRTSGSELTGWPTPTCNVNPQPETPRGLQNIAGAVKLAGWQTPITMDSTGSTHCYSGRNPDGSPKICLKLPGTVLLAGWTTPTTRDWKDTAGMTAQREGRDRLDQLPRQAYTCGPLRLTVFGVMQTGSFVGTENGVQLNPAHSRWLMGFPKAWDTASPHHEHWQAVTESAGSEATATP